MRLRSGWYWSLFSSYICHKASSFSVRESLNLLLKARYYSYLCKEILCAKPFYEEILFYLKDNWAGAALAHPHSFADGSFTCERPAFQTKSRKQMQTCRQLQI